MHSRVSNQMISHEEWFRNMKDLRTLGFVKTNGDIVHPIAQVGKVPLFMQNEQTKYFKDVFMFKP